MENNRKFPMRYILTAIIVVAVSVVSLVFYTVMPSGKVEKYTPLFSGKYFTEQELIEIEMAFAGANLTDYQIADGMVQVPKRQKNAFLLALKKTSLVVREEEKEAEATSSLWRSEREREAGAIVAKQNALASQIRTFNGIENAWVILDVAETKIGFTREKQVTAAISIRSRVAYQVTQADIQSILHLVTGAVCGLSMSDVTIVDTRTNQSWHFDTPKIEAVPENEVYSETAQYEKITLQTEALPQPEIFDSATRQMLGARLETTLETTLETALEPRKNELNSEEEAFVPGRMTIVGGNVMPGRIVLVSRTEAPKEPKQLEELATTETLKILPISEDNKRKSEFVSIRDTERGMTLSSVSQFFGLVATLVIMLCVFVFYLTRKGLFLIKPEELKTEKKTAEQKCNAEQSFREELLSEIITSQEESVSKSENQPEERLSAVIATLENLRNEETATSEKINQDVDVEAENVEAEHFRIPEVEALIAVSPRQLALAFLEERSQTAAMLLSEFPEKRVAEVLAFIPVKARLEIEARMSRIAKPDTEILREAALAIQEHLAELQSDTVYMKEKNDSVAHVSPQLRPLAEILPRESTLNNHSVLKFATEEMTGDVTEDIAGDVTEYATESVQMRYSFEELKRLTDEEMRAFLMTCPQDEAILAFLGAETELVERVLRVLPKNEAMQVRYQLNHPECVRLVDVDNARKRLLQLVERLVSEGKLPSLEMAEVRM